MDVNFSRNLIESIEFGLSDAIFHLGAGASICGSFQLIELWNWWRRKQKTTNEGRGDVFIFPITSSSYPSCFYYFSSPSSHSSYSSYSHISISSTAQRRGAGGTFGNLHTAPTSFFYALPMGEQPDDKLIGKPIRIHNHSLTATAYLFRQTLLFSSVFIEKQQRLRNIEKERERERERNKKEKKKEMKGNFHFEKENLQI